MTTRQINALILLSFGFAAAFGGSLAAYFTQSVIFMVIAIAGILMAVFGTLTL